MTATGARNLKISLAALAALYAASIAIVGSPLMDRDPELLGLGVSLDLTLTATALFYFLAVRPGHVKPAMLVPVFAVGLATAKVILPDAGRGALAYLAAAWGVVEVAIAVWVVANFRRLRHSRAAALLITELRVLRYALGGWFMRAPAAAPGAFTVHRAQSWSVVAGTIAFLVAVESAALHLALSFVSPLAAWIATASSLYALLWVAADAHALRLSRLSVTGDAVLLEVGLRWSVVVPRAAIAEVAILDGKLPRAPGLLRAELLWPGVLLTLREPVLARGPYGIERRVSRISLGVDDREGFLRALQGTR